LVKGVPRFRFVEPNIGIIQLEKELLTRVRRNDSINDGARINETKMRIM
jgi:hypothetical protein